MAALQHEIKELLCVSKTSDSASEKEVYFIPHESLYHLLDKGTVTQAIEGIDEIAWYLKGPTIEWIMKSGRRIFATLIFLQSKMPYISKFMEHDILPFIVNEKIDSGGFGDIYKIKIHPEHQIAFLLPDQNEQYMVRKEFKPPRKKQHSADGDISDEKEEHSNELRNLSILNELKHANIVQMLTSYTHNGRHNLIFPFIQEGNLETLFQGTRPLQFDSDEKFLTALCDLSSAIQEVHYYTLERLNINMIGCHHDLKTKNILVRGETFVLADFGLSKFKEKNDSEESLYAGGGGDYLAPECEDFHDGFERHSVNQSSDIWSFGCIIAEVLTYMRGGTHDLRQFRSLRRIKIGYSMMAAFHGGIGTPNNRALNWISGLRSDSDEYSKPLIQLVLSMLELIPDRRPDAHAATFRLRFITAGAYASQVGSFFSQLASKLPNSFDAHSEWIRFKSWRSVFNDTGVGDDWNQKLGSQTDLMLTIQNLESLLRELKSMISQYETQLSPLFTNIRRLGDNLYRLLPENLRRQAKAKWEIEIMSTEEIENLQEVERTFEGSLKDNRISRLARIKRMSIITSQKCDDKGSELGVDIKFVDLVESCGNQTLALLGSETSQTKKRVVIEWIKYTNRESEIFSKLFSRIKALAYLLHDFPGPTDFRTLHCLAFVHEPRESAFGLLYAYPHQDDTIPKTLVNILKDTANSRQRPTLESRFRLALNLAVSLAGFHSVGWLHKGISPYNILFFVSKDSKPIGWLKEPYLTGFNHSRQDDALAFTVGPATDATERRYHHPDYVHMDGHQAWYAPRFDFYSFGLVLLEIGLWQTLDEIVSRKLYVGGSKAVLDYICTKRVPILGHYMGTAYQNAVLFCLCGSNEPAVAGSTLIKDAQAEFERMVVEPLRGCCMD
ncbi:kinase-like domain-containing protein [Trichoderma pleuroticola]